VERAAGDEATGEEALFPEHREAPRELSISDGFHAPRRVGVAKKKTRACLAKKARPGRSVCSSTSQPQGPSVTGYSVCTQPS